MTTVHQTGAYRAWLGKLKDEKTRAIVLMRVRRLIMGNPGDVKPIGDGASELRIDFGPGYRIYFAFLGKDLLLLLCGGAKGTQTKDIRKAKLLLAKWKEAQK